MCTDNNEGAGTGWEMAPQVGEHGVKSTRYHFLVDGHAFSVDTPQLRGREIKAIASMDITLQLMLEGHGGHPDRAIGDEDLVDLSAPGAEHFYGAPSATYGAICTPSVR